MALYHKHRPQLFSSIVDQETIVTTIQNQLKMNKVSHAYLFSGPRGIGKTTTARVLAKALNCADRKDGHSEPCDVCVSCQEIAAGRSIDVMEIDAASHTGVDNVRENIIDNAQFKPTHSKHKIFIIDEVHMLSTAAFNALLKTLEEPPSYVVFILATTETHKVPATIVSRCQHFVFKKVPLKMLVKHLAAIVKNEEATADEEVLARVARKSEGCVRDAVGLLDQLLAFGTKKLTLDEAELVLPTTSQAQQLQYFGSLLNHQVAEGLSRLDELATSGTHFPQFGRDLVELLRLGLISKVDAELTRDELDLPPEQAREFAAMLALISPAELVELADQVQRRILEIPSAPVPQMPLELLLVEWSARADKKLNSASGQANASSTISTATAQIEPSRSTTNYQTNLPKRSLTEKVRELVHARQLPLADVQRAWPDFLSALETHSPSLLILLKMAQVDGVNGNTVRVKVAHQFHKEKLNDKSCKRILEERLGDIIGDRVKLEFELLDETTAGPDSTKVNSAGTENFQELAAALGGEIIH